MATWLVTAGRGGGITFSSGLSDRFVPPASFWDPDQSNNGDAGVTMRLRYTVERLFLRVSANSLTAASSAAFRIVSVDQSLSVSIPAGVSGVFRDDTNVVITDAGDFDTSHVLIGATGGSITFRLISYLFTDAATQRIFLVLHGAPPLSWPSGITNFSAITGAMGRDSTEDNTVQYTVRALNGVGTTLTNMGVNVANNTIPNASTMTIRKNGANGALTLTIPAETSGGFEDQVNSEAYVGGDEVNYQLATGAGGGTLGTAVFQVLWDAPMRFTAVSGTTTTSGGTTFFSVLEGSNSGGTPESVVQQPARSSFQARNYFVRARANTLDGAFSSFLRVNSADSLLGLVIPAGLTGVFENADDVVDVSALDDVNVSKDASAATAGSISPSYIGFGYIEAPTPVGEPQEPVPGHTSWGIGRRVEMMPY